MSDAETNRYPAHVFWSDDDEGYVAVAPDLPGCSAFGASQQEAMAELQDAIASWIGAARAAGNPIPRPSSPSEVESYSGKILVRMPKSLHAQTAKQARNEGVSLNQYIVFLLTMTTAQRTFEPVVSATRKHYSYILNEQVYMSTSLKRSYFVINKGQVIEGSTRNYQHYIEAMPGNVVSFA